LVRVLAIAGPELDLRSIVETAAWEIKAFAMAENISGDEPSKIDG
jgi:hypothetical protein